MSAPGENERLNRELRADYRLQRYTAFCLEYMRDFNARRAARASGFKNGTALLSRPQVKKILADLVRKKTERLEVNVDRVLRELARVSFINVSDFARVGTDGEFDIDFSRLSPDDFAAVSEVARTEQGAGEARSKTLKLKFASKLHALDLLGQYLKMFTQKVEVSGIDGLAEELVKRRQRAKEGK